MILELCRLMLAYARRGFVAMPCFSSDRGLKISRTHLAINLKASKLVSLEIRDKDIEHFLPVLSFFQENSSACPMSLGSDTITYIFRENPVCPVYDSVTCDGLLPVRVLSTSLIVEPAANDSDPPPYPYWAEGRSLLEVDPPVLPLGLALKLGFRSRCAKSLRKAGELDKFFLAIDNAEKGRMTS